MSNFEGGLNLADDPDIKVEVKPIPEDDTEVTYLARLAAYRTDLQREFERNLGTVMSEAEAELRSAFDKRKEGLENLARQDPPFSDPDSVVKEANTSLDDKMKTIKEQARAKLYLNNK